MFGMRSNLFQLLAAFALITICSSTTPEKRSSEDAFGLVAHDVAYHLLCDKGPAIPLNPPVPRACFETPWHIARALRDPKPANLSGFIDVTGKRFMLRPDAVVTLRNLEIHVMRQKKKPLKEEDKSCVDVLVYRLPEREIQVRENWCAGQFRSIVL